MNKYESNLNDHIVKQITPAPEGLLSQEQVRSDPPSYTHQRIVCLALVEYQDVLDENGEKSDVKVPQVVAVTDITYSDWPPMYAELEQCVWDAQTLCFERECDYHRG